MPGLFLYTALQLVQQAVYTWVKKKKKKHSFTKHFCGNGVSVNETSFDGTLQDLHWVALPPKHLGILDLPKY
uniref:Putative secreted protein n=1 Tax=Ixodes ricinus TaxID=34613 RepID=A0A6B0U0X4_IXORI